MSWHEFDSWEFRQEPKKRSDKPPLDVSTLRVPQSLRELKKLAGSKKNEHRFIYSEMLHLFETASSARAVMTNQDVADFCGSYLHEGLNQNSTWDQMYRDGLEVQERERVANNFREMGQMLSNVRKDAVNRHNENALRKLFGLKK